MENKRNEKVQFYIPIDLLCEYPLPLPLGEVAEHSEDGEGNNDHTKR